MTLLELCGYIKDSSEHYDISDSFMENGYMQGMVENEIIRFNGYVKKARLEGKINKDTKKISQKWHLFNSYLPGYEERDAKVCYARLRCPELLIWIAEACGINKRKISLAAEKARATIDNKGNGRARCCAAREIREIVSWYDIEQVLENSLDK